MVILEVELYQLQIVLEMVEVFQTERLLIYSTALFGQETYNVMQGARACFIQCTISKPYAPFFLKIRNLFFE